MKKRKCKRCRILLKRIKTQADNARVRYQMLRHQEALVSAEAAQLDTMIKHVQEEYCNWGFWRRLKYLFTAR